MTSRRSRLKAVTNLPVRRKVLTPQGNADEPTSADNVAPQKTYTYAQKSEVITFFNSQKNDEVPNKEISESEHTVVVNCAEDVNSSENSVDENVCTKTESEIAGKVENSSDLTANYHDLTTDSSSNSSRNSHSFKQNLILSVKERTEVQTLEKNESEQSLDNQNYTNFNNNTTSNIKDSNDNSNNNSILKDGNKCYTVLTTQSVMIPPLTEFTITPLTPIDNAYINPNVGDEYSTQQYEEVHIYTNIESNEIYVNEESDAGTEPSQSILIKISNGDSESDTNNLHVNFRSLDSNCGETNQDSITSSDESKSLNFKNSFTGNFEHFKSTTGTHSLENSVTLHSHVSGDAPSNKQSLTSIRRKRSKCNDFTKRLADAKREFQKKFEKTKPDRSTLKMIDLIFYNPTTNPMESKIKFEKKDTPVLPSNMIQSMLAEEKVDEPDALDCNIKSQMSDNDEMENLSKMPVPQVKIGLDGEIILDEKSVIIETTDAKKGREELQNSVPIFEDRGCNVSYYRGKSRKSRDWTDFETKRFYKALNTIGPDFSLMQKYFPKRSRLELKNKFKREEKLNRNLIDKALNNPSEFDMTVLEKDLAIEQEAEEEEIEMRLCKIMKRNRRKHRVKSSALSREMIESDEDSENSQSEILDAKSRQMSESDKTKKKMEFDFVLQKILMKE